MCGTCRIGFTFFVDRLLETGGEDWYDPVVLTEDVDECGCQLSMMVLEHLGQDLNGRQVITQ